MNNIRTHELIKRILFTVLILAIYLVGRSIILYGVPDDTELAHGLTAQNVVITMLSGDVYQRTIMALGVMPYINASLLVQVISAFKSAGSRAKVSKQKQERWMIIAAVIITVFMAIIHTQGMEIDPGPLSMGAAKFIVLLEIIGGAMLTFFLCETNEKNGIGASMPIIMVNVITSFVGTLNSSHFLNYPYLILACAIVVIATAYLENSLVKIPLQRVSIHNIHADENYLAYKRNPVGIMPVMFASAVLMAVQYFFIMLEMIFPDNRTLPKILDQLSTTKPAGIILYLLIIIGLTYAFAFIMLNPMETARALQRNGDSIIGIYAGKDTRRYLVRQVLGLSFTSGLLQAGCMAVFLILAYANVIPAALAMIPTSVMILVSIICTFTQEISTYYRYDSYKFFI